MAECEITGGRMNIQDVYNSVKKQVKTNPRKCDVCGCIETMNNLILKYEGYGFLCDECMIVVLPDPEF